MNVHDVTDQILNNEGSEFTYDPNDPGGPTKWGVTLATMQHLNLDLNHDGKVTIDDVKMMTKDVAGKVFESDYYYKPRLYMLPVDVQPAVYDMQVNSGSQAVKILQNLLNQIYGRQLTVDGIVGPNTATAAKLDNFTALSISLNDAYCRARREWYYKQASDNPKLRKFANTRSNTKGGWIIRAEEFMTNKQHIYTEQQHLDRISQWPPVPTEGNS